MTEAPALTPIVQPRCGKRLCVFASSRGFCCHPRRSGNGLLHDATPRWCPLGSDTVNIYDGPEQRRWV